MPDNYKEFLLKQRDSQSKFDYFFIGLSLGFLAITFQTNHISEELAFEYILLIAWFAMLVSIFFGILRLRRIYILYSKETDHIKMTIQFPEKKTETDDFFSQEMEIDQKFLLSKGRIQFYSFFISLCFYFLFHITKIYPYLFDLIKWKP